MANSKYIRDLNAVQKLNNAIEESDDLLKNLEVEIPAELRKQIREQRKYLMTQTKLLLNLLKQISIWN